MQIIEGCLCIALGGARDTLAGTIVVLVLFSLFVQSAEGATYAIVPFVSRRALGVVSGVVGAGGNAGAVICQQIYFKGVYTVPQGIIYMGVMILCMTAVIPLIYFPMWGGMFWCDSFLFQQDQSVLLCTGC